ncbi:chemotaxis protein CheW [Undibacterium sp. 14-3-2]|uniref:chemotaxis protein CheW n=1 Tax=Undibacterium sp. 14-3-2 TaxID=2800129 RepID=UPI0019058D4E|nr:chemotaxis protein CheW [Undibacterium sp. 14-3-2]
MTLAATSVALNGAHRNDSSLSMTFCRLGDLRFAVPLNDVVQAIRQPQLTLLPRRDQAIAGVFVYRQQTIPLLDLRRWLPWSDERSELPGQILLLRQNAHLVGVAIDQVEGLQRVPGSQIQRVVQREDDEELFHSTVSIAAGEQESQALGLLDVDALIRLSQVWSAADEEFAASIAAADSELAATTAATAASASTVPHALFELAGQVLAIPAADVAAVISMPVVTTILGRHPAWLGMTIWRERDVPVLRTMAALGLPPQAADESAHDTSASAQENLLVILGSEGRYAGLPVQVARAVTPLDTSAAQTAASAGLPANTVLSGVLHLNAAERLLLVDGAELVNTCSLSALSQKNASAKQDQQNQQPDQPNQADLDAALQAHVVVQGGRAWAVGMRWLEAIIHFPEQLDTNTAGNPAQLGNFIWNQQTLALWDLRMLSNQTPTPDSPERRVLIMRIDGMLIGLAVEQLLILLPARSGKIAAFGRRQSGVTQIITVRDQDQEKTYSILNPAEYLPLQQALAS